MRWIDREVGGWTIEDMQINNNERITCVVYERRAYHLVTYV